MESSDKEQNHDEKIRQSKVKAKASLKPVGGKKRKKCKGRFDGIPEAEVVKRRLPDIIAENLEILIIGINPGLTSAYKGHHYAGPGNHFWKCLYMSELVPEALTFLDDHKCLEYSIGFTNIVHRTTASMSDLTREEIKKGAEELLEKIKEYNPKVAVFNGKTIYEIFSGKKDFKLGLQTELIEGTNTHIFVMPSSSARCAHLPRAEDKLQFYQALKRFRDHLNDINPVLDFNELVFDGTAMKRSPKKKPCETNKGEKSDYF